MNFKYSDLTKFLVWIHIAMWILIVPVAELQMIFFGKKLITLFVLGIVEFIVLMILILIPISRKEIKLNPISQACFNYIAVMMTLWFIGFVVNRNTPLYWKFYFVFYWIMPALIIMVGSQVKFDFKPVLKWITIIAILNAILVIVQHFGNTLIWPFEVDDQGNALFFISSNYYNRKQMIRCPGLCMSGLDSGTLMIFGMIHIYGDHEQKLWKRIILICFLIYATWFTGTRNVYLFLAFIVGCIFINFFFKGMPYVVKNRITLAYTLICFIVVVYIQIILGAATQSVTRNIFTDFTSMNARFKTWQSVIADFLSGNKMQQLFGRFVWQSAGYPLVIDNMYLELLIMVGIVGMLCFCYFILQMILLAFRQRSDLLIPYYSYFLGIFIYGSLNVIGSINLTFLMIFGILISQMDEGEKLKTENQPYRVRSISKIGD